MNNLTKNRQKSLRMVELALLGGIVVVMAFVPFLGYIPLGFTRATIIHVPVIIGSLILGPRNGAALGFLFGLTSLVNNTVNPTATSFVFSPFYSVGEFQGGIGSLIICFVPRILVGIVPYYIFKLIIGNGNKLSRFRSSSALVSCGIAGALTNTLLVMNLIFVFFSRNYATVNKVAVDSVYKFIAGIIAVNGIPEAIVAGVIVLALLFYHSPTISSYVKLPLISFIKSLS